MCVAFLEVFWGDYGAMYHVLAASYISLLIPLPVGVESLFLHLMQVCVCSFRMVNRAVSPKAPRKRSKKDFPTGQNMKVPSRFNATDAFFGFLDQCCKTQKKKTRMDRSQPSSCRHLWFIFH